MLRPRHYPEMLGKALVFEPEPFITMVDDDAPLSEGLFLTVCVGVLIGVAQLIGGLLFTVSMPPVGAVETVVAQIVRQMAGTGLAPLSAAVEQGWSIIATVNGYGAGWVRVANLIWEPFFLLLQWLLFGLIVHGVARAQGGTGRLAQTLGAVALMAAPSLLLIFNLVPFVSVSSVLLLVWSVLIVYRAVQVAHDLPWQRAALTALAPVLAFAVLALLGGALTALLWALS